MRAILLFIIGLTFGFGAGFLTGGGMGHTAGHDHAGHADAGHDMMAVTAWEGAPPVLSLTLTPDMGRDFNLRITADGFTFDPENVNAPTTAGTGHAHVYVNGEKVARAYSPYMHLTNVPEGAIVRVTLNTNEHGHWGLDGEPIAAEITAP